MISPLRYWRNWEFLPIARGGAPSRRLRRRYNTNQTVQMNVRAPKAPPMMGPIGSSDFEFSCTKTVTVATPGAAPDMELDEEDSCVEDDEEDSRVGNDEEVENDEEPEDSCVDEENPCVENHKKVETGEMDWEVVDEVGVSVVVLRGSIGGGPFAAGSKVGIEE